jgi:putative PIN family toxin of toxin-antitoxin system
VAALVAAVEAGLAEVFIDAACEAELARVLAYPLRKPPLTEAMQKECLVACKRLSSQVVSENRTIELPRCADPDDQKFLALAAAARANVLVTKDAELLALARKPLPFRIISPGAFSLA